MLSPFFIPGWQGKAGAAVKAHELGNAELKAEYSSKIQGLLFSLDELNQSLMMNFRGAYLAFITDPCANGAMLARQVENILREQHRLQLVRVQIRGLVTLAGQGNRVKIIDAFQRIVDQIGGPIAEAAVDEIATSRAAMQKWIGESE